MTKNMMLVLLLCLASQAIGQNMDDCRSMDEKTCKNHNLCRWKHSVCKIGFVKCEGLNPVMCNAADHCKWENDNGLCRGSNCPSGYTASECRAQNVYSHECAWLVDEEKCIPTNICMAMQDSESCRTVANMGCHYTQGGCKPHDPCNGKNPTTCMSEGGDYRCTMAPGACYGDAVGNLEKKMQDPLNFKYELVEENTLTAQTEKP